MATKMKNASNGLKMILIKFHHVELTPEVKHGLANSTWAKRIKIASNGFKIVLAKFHHDEFPPPQSHIFTQTHTD